MFLLLLACSSPPVPAPTPEPEPAPAEAAPSPMRQAIDQVRELPVPDRQRYAASQIVIAYKGAVAAPSTIERTEEQAFVEASKLAERARTEDFATLARQHSDGPSGRRGGSLGTYRVGTMLPDFERAVAATEVGEIGPLVATPFGWHVIRRDPIEEVHVRHIQVSFAGTRNGASSRTREEALALVRKLEREVTPQTFAGLARKHSDDTVTAGAGGDLGPIPRGQMMPAFEGAAFALDPGAVSEVVETPYGFHLIFREPAESPTEPPHP